MQGRNLALIAVAAFVALIAVIIANAYFSGVEQRQQILAQRQQMVRIVVASQPLEFGAKLTPANVQMQLWPAASVPEGAFRSLPDAFKDNRVVLRPMVPGEPVLASKVSGTDGRATLAALLPAGMRAVSIPIGPVSSVAGFALPGMRVDVLLTRKIPGDGATAEDMRSDVILRDVPVLAVDQTVDEKTGKPLLGKTATVQVTLFDAQRLAIADKIGSLSLALRNTANLADATEVAAEAGTATNRDLGGARIYGGRLGMRPAAQGFVMPPAYAPPAASRAIGEALRPVGPTMTVFRGTTVSELPIGTGGY